MPVVQYGMVLYHTIVSDFISLNEDKVQYCEVYSWGFGRHVDFCSSKHHRHQQLSSLLRISLLHCSFRQIMITSSCKQSNDSSTRHSSVTTEMEEKRYANTWYGLVGEVSLRQGYSQKNDMRSLYRTPLWARRLGNLVVGCGRRPPPG